MDPTALVPAFNTLPRTKLFSSGSVPNHWHVSLRPVPLEPSGHLLFIINPPSRSVYVEGPMPPEYSNASPEVQATTVAMLLLKAFNGGLGAAQEVWNGIGRPWSWVCQDAEMAGAVGETLRGMGIVAPEGMGVAASEENKIADEEWAVFLARFG